MTSKGNGHPPVLRPITLEAARNTFRRWLGEHYDTGVLDAVLCAIAAERLDGDPPWLMVVAGSGAAKTETVVAAFGAGALVESTISSEGALLSATAAKERTKNANGGLLRKIGERGVLVIKDVTSIVSMDRTTRGMVLSALREIHDGRWSRNVGTDGGRSLQWEGRIVVIGACTTAWDRAHEVVSQMGDRFVIVRIDSAQHRQEAGLQALANTGRELEMRAELAAAIAGVIAGLKAELANTIEQDERTVILAAADLVTLARTAVDYDYRGNVIDSHAPEAPTRFAKQLVQLMRGGLALGMTRDQALALVIRCARDSMPPLRLAILLDVAANPATTCSDVRRRLEKPYSTVDRQLQALHQLGILDCEVGEKTGAGNSWRYRVKAKLDPSVLTFTRKVDESGFRVREVEIEASPALSAHSHKAGEGPAGVASDWVPGEPPVWEEPWP